MFLLLLLAFSDAFGPPHLRQRQLQILHLASEGSKRSLEGNCRQSCSLEAMVMATFQQLQQVHQRRLWLSQSHLARGLLLAWLQDYDLHPHNAHYLDLHSTVTPMDFTVGLSRRISQPPSKQIHLRLRLPHHLHFRYHPLQAPRLPLQVARLAGLVLVCPTSDPDQLASLSFNKAESCQCAHLLVLSHHGKDQRRHQ